MSGELLLVGTHRRAQHADPQDVAFGIYGLCWRDGLRAEPALTSTPQPGWIARHPALPVCYAVNEVKVLGGVEGGAVSAFGIDGGNGRLTPLGGRPTPPAPCHCAVDPSGRFLVVATFGGGSVHLFRLEPDGAIGAEADSHRHEGSSVHPRRQAGPHAHAAVFEPAGRFVFVPDLGIDRLLVYRLDVDGARLVPLPGRTVALPPGSGPRHAAFAPDGRFAYLVNEMSATVAVFSHDGEGGLRAIETVDLLPDGFTGLRSGAAILVAPSGRFLYATTRSHGSSGMPPEPGLDRLVWFAIDPYSGRLRLGGRLPSGGGIPRAAAFGRGATRLLVAHQASGTVVAFALDADDGRPVPTGEIAEVPVPVCLCVVDAAPAA